MKFLVYSSTNDQTIRSNLGGVDYSYYFVLKRYLPLLERLGTVEVLDAPLSTENEADWQVDDQTWYFSFTPPNAVELSSGARIVPVFAWEFGTLPDEAFVSDSDDWKHVLEQCGQAITHSGYAVEVARKSIGDSYPIVSIPAPVWDDFQALREEPGENLAGAEHFTLDATVLDSRDFEVSGEQLVPLRNADSSSLNVIGRVWQGEEILLDGKGDRNLPVFLGSGQRPDGGYWSSEACTVLLPAYLDGSLVLEFEVRLEQGADPRFLELEMAGCSARVYVSELFSTHRLVLQLERPTNSIYFSAGVESNTQSHPAFSVSAFRISAFTEDKELPESNMDLARDGSAQWLGAHHAEDWGRWTEGDTCSVVLPRSVMGNVRITFNINMSMMEVGHTFKLMLGEKDFTVKIGKMPQAVRLDASGIGPTDHLEFSQLSPTAHDTDPRTLGLGLSDLAVTVLPPSFPASALSWLDGLARRLAPVKKDGVPESYVTYTTIFNPIDGRKNWPDIIKAFVFALRDRPDALLLIKLTHTELQPFVDDLASYFLSLAPFRCRIAFVHGFLGQDDYTDLVRNTSFVVNASRGEGQCLPLMEYMSSGVPAISPDNTAMADYVTPENSFIVKSTVEPAVWPQDPRMLFRTTRYRINWESLYLAFQESYRVAKTDKQSYTRMSEAAIESLRNYCSMDVAEQRLREFLGAQPVVEPN